jgi:hypothetical protein
MLQGIHHLRSFAGSFGFYSAFLVFEARAASLGWNETGRTSSTVPAAQAGGVVRQGPDGSLYFFSVQARTIYTP